MLLVAVMMTIMIPYHSRPMEKKCFKCNKVLDIELFYKHVGMKDGHLNKCIECTKIDESNRYKLKYSDPEWLLKERERCREKARIYRSNGRQKSSQKAFKEWCLRNSQKRNCHNKVKTAIKSGLLTKGLCEVCSSPEVHAHHDDYSKPLEVRWLCVIHHNELHVKQRNEQLLSLISDKNCQCNHP